MTMQVRAVALISNSMVVHPLSPEPTRKLLAEARVVRARELAVRVPAGKASGCHEGACAAAAPAEVADVAGGAPLDVVDARHLRRRAQAPLERVAQGKLAHVQHVAGVDRAVRGNAERLPARPAGAARAEGGECGGVERVSGRPHPCGRSRSEPTELLVTERDVVAVFVEAGVGGSSLARDASKITLLDVFDAVEGDASLLGFHAHPSPACPVGSHIHDVLDGPLSAAQDALRASLARTTIADLLAQL